MKVLFIARNTLFKVTGGDTVQVLETAAHLRELGIEVDVKITGEVFDYSKYDLIHFFNIIRPSDILPHIQNSKLPFVVSTIFVDYTEFEKNNRHGIKGLILRFMHTDAAEYVKNIVRSLIRGDDKIHKGYLFYGHRKSLIKVAEKAVRLLPNSNSEYKRLQMSYGIDKPYTVIPNGINTSIFHNAVQKTEKDVKLVLCVARIEGRKNQLRLIEALNNTDYTLLLIGDPAPNQNAYYKLCKKKAASNIEFIHQLPQHELEPFYRRAKVHVLPSWFETTGLSSLEAGIMGCNIVISDRGDVREYFGDQAFYCDPSSAISIKQCIDAAASAPVNEQFQQYILEHYTWKKAAMLTAKVYNQILA
ncbi:MAG: glycosyltransferase family 4 protein [Chitinophagaceae bacterium]|jgi:glycosyltransferase involved in cell wall biosynthesis